MGNNNAFVIQLCEMLIILGLGMPVILGRRIDKRARNQKPSQERWVFDYGPFFMPHKNLF
jgi:hypothetical protein